MINAGRVQATPNIATEKLPNNAATILLLHCTNINAAVAAKDYVSGLEHFILYGQAEGRAATWDEQLYLTTYTDVASGVSGGKHASGLDHFLNFGKSEGRNISKYFDETYYKNNNSDVVQVISDGWFRSGYEHYVLFGQYEGRSPKA